MAEVGYRFRAAIAKNAGVWGDSVAQALGAGDGFEINSSGLQANASLVENEGVSGQPFRRVGSLGALIPEGDVDFDLYYRDAGWRAIAGVMGLDSISGAGPYTHDISVVATPPMQSFTFATPGDEGVDELNHCKVVTATLKWDQSRYRGQCVSNFLGFEKHLNIGPEDDDFVVTSVAAANGALTITAGALAEFTPSPLIITKVAGITAITFTIVGEDEYGKVRTEAVTHTSFVSEIYRGYRYYRKITSITISGLTGTGNVKVGITGGANNLGTASAITLATERDCINFNEMQFFMKRQADATDFLAADEYPLSALEIGITLNPDKRPTTKFGSRINEPVRGGGGWPEITIAANVSGFETRHRQAFFDMVSKSPVRCKAVFTGPPITGGGTHSLTVFMQGIQVASGDRAMGGPAVVPFDLSATAHVVSAVPTGFPAGMTYPLHFRLVNGLSTAII
jgi:hypothetical protein